MGERGKFITFEGIDRSGKSTQSAVLKRNLDTAGIRCMKTAEPGGSGELGLALRELLLNPDIERDEVTATMLFMADRHEHVKKIIQPTLDKGNWVICDRFLDSTTAYQGGGGNVDRELLATLNKVACRGLAPDLTVLLDIDFDKRYKRSPKLDYYDQGRKSYELRVSKAFKEIAAGEPERFLVVDAAKSVDEVGDEIMAEVSRRFLTGG